MAGELIIAVVGGAIYALWRTRRTRKRNAIAAAAHELGRLLRRFRPPVPESSEPVIVPPADALDSGLRLDAGPVPPGIPAHNLALIEYVDAEQRLSRRRITVQRVSWLGPDDAYLFSYCHERQANRTFLLRRVKSVTDMQTGEMFSAPVEYFRGVAPEDEGTPLERVFRAMECEILALVYLARADARMVADERQEIAGFIAGAQRGTTASVAQIDQRIKRTRCEDDEFVEAMQALSGRPENQREALFDAAQRVMNADGRQHPAESEIVEKLRAALGLAS